MLAALRASFGRGGFAIRLLARLHRRVPALLLLVEDFAAAVNPLVGLLARLASAGHHEIASFFGRAQNRVARFGARFGSVQNAHYRTNAEPGKEPQKSTPTFVACHNASWETAEPDD